jgi:hypothetical protein
VDGPVGQLKKCFKSQGSNDLSFGDYGNYGDVNTSTNHSKNENCDHIISSKNHPNLSLKWVGSK